MRLRTGAKNHIVARRPTGWQRAACAFRARQSPRVIHTYIRDRRHADDRATHCLLYSGKHAPLLDKAHLRLLGVHVHIDLRRVDLHEDYGHRIASDRQQCMIRLHHGVRQTAVFDITTIHEEIDGAAVSACQAGQADVAIDAYTRVRAGLLCAHCGPAAKINVERQVV